MLAEVRESSNRCYNSDPGISLRTISAPWREPRLAAVLRGCGRFMRGAKHVLYPADRKSTRLNSSHYCTSRMQSFACTKKKKQRPHTTHNYHEPHRAPKLTKIKKHPTVRIQWTQ